MFDQELLSMWGEWRLREVLESGNYPSDYLSLDENNIWLRIALENYILKCVQNHSYASFYQYEMKIRKTLKYPPFYYLVLSLKEIQ